MIYITSSGCNLSDYIKLLYSLTLWDCIPSDIYVYLRNELKASIKRCISYCDKIELFNVILETRDYPYSENLINILRSKIFQASGHGDLQSPIIDLYLLMALGVDIDIDIIVSDLINIYDPLILIKEIEKKITDVKLTFIRVITDDLFEVSIPILEKLYYDVNLVLLKFTVVHTINNMVTKKIKSGTHDIISYFMTVCNFFQDIFELEYVDLYVQLFQFLMKIRDHMETILSIYLVTI